MTTGSTPGDIPPTTPTGTTGTPGTAGTSATTGGAGASGFGSSTGTTATTGTADTSSATRDVAKDEARGVAQDAAQSTRQTAETAKEQAGQVAEEAKSQARRLLDETRQQVTSTGVAQQERAASGLRSIADELTGMVEGTGGQSGLASDLARQASERVRTVADFLESREPADLLHEVRSFARRRPGAFLLSAAAIGFVGGRMTRGLAADSSTGSTTGSSTGYLGAGTSTGSIGTGMSGTGMSTGSLTTAPGASSLSGTPAGDTVPTGPAGTGGGIGARSGSESDWDRPAGGDAPLSGYAVPPERSGAEPHGDPTATFHPGPQTGGPAEDRI